MTVNDFRYGREAFYYETDKMGIVHNSNYLRWFEEARIAFLNEAGLSYDEMEKRGIASPVLEAAAEYKAPVRFSDKFYITLKAELYDGIRLMIAYEVKEQKTDRLFCKGRTKHCFLNSEGRVISLKRSFPDIHELLCASFKEEKEC